MQFHTYFPVIYNIDREVITKMPAKYQYFKYVKKNANKYGKKFFKKTNVSRAAKKGLKQVADIQCKAFLHPYFTLMCN